MRIISLPAIAATAICLSGYPAIAQDSAPITAKASPELAAAEMRSAIDAYATARPLAEKGIREHAGQPLVVDDLTEALGYGDYLAHAPIERQRPARLREMALFLWGVVAHIVNVTLPATSRT